MLLKPPLFPSKVPTLSTRALAEAAPTSSIITAHAIMAAINPPRRVLPVALAATSPRIPFLLFQADGHGHPPDASRDHSKLSPNPSRQGAPAGAPLWLSSPSR